MLLLPLAFAAETVPDRAVVLVTERTTIGAATAASLEVQNVGARPATLTVDRGSLGGASSVTVPARRRAEVGLRHDGPCRASDWGPCANGSVRLGGPGGEIVVQVEVLPPGVGVLGMLPSRLYWDPSGPPPPPGGTGSIGDLFGSLSAPVSTLPALDPGAPVTTAAPGGPVRTRLSHPEGAAARLEELERALAATVAACDTRAPDSGAALAVAGALGWGADGRVSGVRVEQAAGVSERCVVVGLFAAAVGAGPGASGFRASGEGR